MSCDGGYNDDRWDTSLSPLNWTVAAYKTQFPNYADVWLFNSMFSDGRSTSMYKKESVRDDTDIGSWNP